MYKIEISYKTGDSFSSHDATTILECTFKDLNVAKENLQRIKIHQEYYNSINRSYKLHNVIKPNCWIDSKYGDDSGSLRLITDNGTEFIIDPFWQGYFERLNAAEIISSNHYDMKIEF